MVLIIANEFSIKCLNWHIWLKGFRFLTGQLGSYIFTIFMSKCSCLLIFYDCLVVLRTFLNIFWDSQEFFFKSHEIELNFFVKFIYFYNACRRCCCSSLNFLEQAKWFKVPRHLWLHDCYAIGIMIWYHNFWFKK